MMTTLPRFLLLILVTFAVSSKAQSPSSIIFIVNAENPNSSISRDEVRDFYFKRKRSWPDGTGVRFLDRTTGSQPRREFVRNVLQKRADEIDMYWIGQKLYSGESAPLQESSDAMTIRFVESFRGAIGYVSSTAVLEGRKVKVIQVGP